MELNEALEKLKSAGIKVKLNESNVNEFDEIFNAVWNMPDGDFAELKRILTAINDEFDYDKATRYKNKLIKIIKDNE